MCCYSRTEITMCIIYEQFSTKEYFEWATLQQQGYTIIITEHTAK